MVWKSGSGRSAIAEPLPTMRMHFQPLLSGRSGNKRVLLANNLTLVGPSSTLSSTEEAGSAPLALHTLPVTGQTMLRRISTAVLLLSLVLVAAFVATLGTKSRTFLKPVGGRPDVVALHVAG